MMPDNASMSLVSIVLLVALNLLTLSLMLGLIRAWIGPTTEDRFSAILLLGTGGVAILLLLALLLGLPALYDVALVLALLAIVGTVALTRLEAHDD